MSQNVFEVFQQKDIQEQWEKIYSLHQRTKTYLLQAEEVCPDGFTLIQPLKEHRDAYDHIIRIFASTCKTVPEDVDYVRYVRQNLSKAYAHEYRAFYDTADWFSYTLRKEIRTRIQRISLSKRRNVIPNYDQIAKLLNSFPFDVADFRNDKDIGSDNIEKSVVKYSELLDQMIEIYKSVVI